MGVPILPVAISGTNAALPKYSLNFHGRQRLFIRLLPPIGVEQVSGMSVEGLAEMARAMIAGELAKLTSA